MNKPVAIRYDFDGYGYQYMDSGSGSDWQTRVDGEPLYTHPVKELHLSLQKSQDGELLAVTYTDDEHRIVEVLWEKPPVKELTLTDEEILKLADETCLTAWIAINPIMDIEKQKQIAKQKMIEFAKAILRKAQEK